MYYIDIVNQVLRRLREQPVSSLYENKRSSIVADFVNDAKNQVENGHDWSDLRTDKLFVTAADLGEYSLVGSSNKATVKDVRDLTNGAFLTRISTAYIRRQELISNPGTTRPSYWALEGSDSNGDAVMKLWPVPDAAYNISVHMIQRTPDLVAEGDELVIPAPPVILLATAMSAEDRGDVDAASLQSLYSKAKSSIAQHVMLDVGKNPEEMVWYPV